MTRVKFSPRAARLKRAAELLYGPRGGTKFAKSVGISRQMWNFIATGRSPVSDDVKQLAAEALRREAKRLRTTAEKLDEMAEKMTETS
jgi:hypothetical protein